MMLTDSLEPRGPFVTHHLAEHRPAVAKLRIDRRQAEVPPCLEFRKRVRHTIVDSYGELFRNNIPKKYRIFHPGVFYDDDGFIFWLK